MRDLSEPYVKRTVTRLDDGRELIYFDERDDVVRDEADRRRLPPPPPGAELRYDPLLDEWVAIAAHRQSRTFLPPSSECPLCPSTPDRSTEIPASDYDVVVFENRFPTFSQRPPEQAFPAPTPLVPVRPATGRCEVVCFTSDHDASFATLSLQRVGTVMSALADRTAELSALPGVEQVMCFENRGEAIGVTLHHPHGQIYAYPFVPPRQRAMLTAARSYADRTGGLLMSDVLAAERSAGDRLVVECDTLDRVRASSRAMALRGACGAPPPRPGPHGSHPRGDIRIRHDLSGCPPSLRYGFRSADAIRCRLVPGSGQPSGPRGGVPASPAHQPATSARQAEVSGRIRDGHGCVQ